MTTSYSNLGRQATRSGQGRHEVIYKIEIMSWQGFILVAETD